MYNVSIETKDTIMDKLNPFNILMYALNFLYGIYGYILVTFFTVWRLACSVLWIWLVIALLLPDINFVEHITMLMNTIVIDPVVQLMYFFSEFAEVIRTDYLIPESNGFKIAFYLMGWLFFIGLTLLVMPLLWFGWFVHAYFGFATLLSGEAKWMFFGATLGGGTSGNPSNLSHLFMGRTSYAEVYDADVKANAIAEALSRKSK